MYKKLKFSEITLTKIKENARKLAMDNCREMTEQEMEEERDHLNSVLEDGKVVYTAEGKVDVIESTANLHEWMYMQGCAGKSIIPKKIKKSKKSKK